MAIIGVILCGGLSSRMGRDKGLLELEGQTMVSRAYDLLQPHVSQIVYSIRSSQSEAYAYMQNKAIICPDDPDIDYDGPLKGIGSCHRIVPYDDLLVTACDMIIPEDCIHLLIDHYHQQPGYDIYVIEYNGYPEPLLAIYTNKAFDVLNHHSHIQSPSQWIKTCQTLHIPILNPSIKISNLNTPEDVEQIKTHKSL